MRSQTQLAKWGTSVGLRIPKPILEAARLREGDPVALEVIAGSIVVHPVKAERSLEDMVKAISPSNRHGETDWGEPAGKESW